MSSSQSCMEVTHLSALKQRVSTAAQNLIDFLQDSRDVIKKLENRPAATENLLPSLADKNQSEMKLLTTALVIVLLTTASAKPTGWRRHHDADIADNGWKKGLLDGKHGWSSRSTESSSYKDSSSESRESNESSESESSEESSEEVLITDQTTPVVTTTAMSTITTGDGSMLTPEPDTMSTDEPTITVTTPLTTPTPGSVSHCITEEIPTPVSITENRGDN
ncbi:secretory calcium-binding phosphoprotein 8 [Siniperca chuatsi]|uniref:secretory calcium-binding phosphoprotein 8 n=1 Tax=Siniperca chuatsi TaxID=119488 RepID=UPI001CE12C0C|nr:secretory calcium-binding phosphoprotein 8 [Siniperca chuatsi]